MFLFVSGLKAEGIFRRSANASILKSVQKMFNEGIKLNMVLDGSVTVSAFFEYLEKFSLKNLFVIFLSGDTIDFDKFQDIHIPAAILKSFLRQLPEPLMTYDQYDHLVKVQSRFTTT